MKITGITRVTTAARVLDTTADEGYLQGASRQMPDVDVDFPSDRRQEVKEYLERRYNRDGRQRVFSAGTFSTLKLKACLKDVCRVHRVPVPEANYITALLGDSDTTWTDLFRAAARSARVRRFVNDYPQAVEDMRLLMGQPRTGSVHASAILITPDSREGEAAECFDFTPVKRVEGVLVSELDGYALDETGLLKNDCLGIVELTKIRSVLDEINREYGAGLSFEDIVRSDLNDGKTYRLLAEGCTANVFQMSAAGITRYLQDMRPERIDDLIAATALYRPATLESGSAEKYLRRKLGEEAPVYLWGTHEALRGTYGVMTFQEQISQIAREAGGFSLSEGVRLVKLISKKKAEAIHAMREKFMTGAAARGCPREDAGRIWTLIESSGSYLLNKAHATAYAITAYVGAWLKANYPTAFYTVALQYADDKEIGTLISEMERCSKARLVPPDINRSQVRFWTDYRTDSIYWSLGRIKMVGARTAEYIVRERERSGEFADIGDFIRRIFRHRFRHGGSRETPDDGTGTSRFPVNARHVRHLILAGCFDAAERIDSEAGRYGILQRAAGMLGFALDEREFDPRHTCKPYFWTRLQIAVSGTGSIDYRRIFDSSPARQRIRGRTSYMSLREAARQESEGKRVAVCATVTRTEELSYKDRTGGRSTCCKMTLQQNADTMEAICWSDFYSARRSEVATLRDRIVILTATVRYSDYSGANTLHITKNSIILPQE